jgi:hypothetical protein
MEELDIDNTEDTLVQINKPVKDKSKKDLDSVEVSKESEEKLICCLKDEKIIVKFIPREGGLISDPRHVLFGGLGPKSKIKYTVPQAPSKSYVQVLTPSEQSYLEYIMFLPKGSMSVHNKQNNYWANKTVVLTKEDKVLDLNDPEDYISYKILLANKDFIAPSEEALKKYRKGTYRFKLVRDSEDQDVAIQSLNVTSKAYRLFSEVNSDPEKLSLIIELCTGRSIKASDVKTMYAQVDKIIRDIPKKFIETIEDEYLDTKLLINKGIESGHIRKRGKFYYLTEGNKPLCTGSQEPTLKSACEYLNMPKYQEVKLLLEAKIKE